MSTVTKNAAKSTLAAAFAFALALGTTATPAFANTSPFECDQRHATDDHGLPFSTAIEIVRVYFGVDSHCVACPNCIPCEHNGRTCYRVSFITLSWLDPTANNEECHLRDYVAYLDVQTGEVIESQPC